MPRAVSASLTACCVGPTRPATIASGRLVQAAAVSAASSSTGLYSPTSRIADRVGSHTLAERDRGGMAADRESAGAGVDVIARQRALMARVERAIGIERERMRRE